MADIQVKRVESSGKKTSLRELYATVCYYFPQYTLKDAEQLSARDFNLLLKMGKKIHARHMIDVLHIVSAPHSKDKNQVKNLLEHFKKLAED